ncbi:MAG: hypothetical protein FWG73_00165 [Planctomycetaceae bacterium]|nr:hypothetical protein [Planctomycetaceae bacterium]
MNHHDLEQQLRKLKPTAVAYRLPENPQVAPRHAYGSLRMLNIGLSLTAVALLLVLLYLGPPERGLLHETVPEITVANVESPIPEVNTLKFSTARQLSREMLSEMQPATDRKIIAEYPVIELTVADGADIRRQGAGVRRQNMFFNSIHSDLLNP